MSRDHEDLVVDLEVGGHCVERGDVALMPIDETKCLRPCPTISSQRLVRYDSKRLAERDRARVAGMDRGDAVLARRNDNGVEDLGELCGDQIRGHRVGSAREVRAVLLNAPKRHHHNTGAAYKLVHLGGREVVDRSPRHAYPTFAGGGVTTGWRGGWESRIRRASAAA